MEIPGNGERGRDLPSNAGVFMLDPQLERIARTLGPSRFPRKLALELCADCNLACSMCHHPEMRRPKGVMPFLLWKKCADEVARVDPDTEVWFSFCGEPLMEPDLLVAFLRYGRQVGLRSLNVNTNGQLLVPEVAGPLLTSGVGTIVIGIDGFSSPVYASVRVNGDRDVVYRNVEHLLELRRAMDDGPEIQVQFIEMDENEHEMRAFAEYWLERGATVKVRNKLSWGGRLDTPAHQAADDRIPCPWALTMMHVFWDGRVPRCSGDVEGEDFQDNAWHAPLTEIWGRLAPYRQLHLDRRFDELPDRCHDCRDWMSGAAERVRDGQLDRLERRRRKRPLPVPVSGAGRALVSVKSPPSQIVRRADVRPPAP
ncbi:MAG: radical SAM protein [Gemmatimonadales bacterium]|nr:MAG: radical SAM protein [Gemmatimonadales bacterium]